ncbi:MAG: hypothetical protein AB7E47_05820 [Desulfovibrionaceae bacterium]
MRVLAEAIITTAAVAAGLPATAIMDKPDRETALLPEKRLQLEYMDEILARSSRRIAKFASEENPDTHRTVRHRRYRRTLMVRAEVVADDPDWLAIFVDAFIRAMPHKTADADNNLVTVKVNKAVRGGFALKTVEVFARRSAALHISVEGMLCEDEEVPLIRDVNLVDGVTTA